MVDLLDINLSNFVITCSIYLKICDKLNKITSTVFRENGNGVIHRALDNVISNHTQ